MADDFTPLYEDAGSVWNVDPRLLRAVAQTESGENPNVPDGAAGDSGLMQFIPSTARQYGVANPRDPTQAVFGAAHYLSDLLGQHNGNVPVALAAYNGSGADPNATYARKVLANYQALPQIQTAQADRPGAPQSGPTAGMSDDDVMRSLAAPPTSTPAPAAAPATSPVPTAGPTAGMSDEQVLQNLTAAPASPASPAVPAQAPAATAAPTPLPYAPPFGPTVRNYANAMIGGLGTGIGDVARSVNRLTGGALGPLPGAAPPPDIQQAMAAHPWASGGARMAGNVIATAPAMMAGGEALAAVPGASLIPEAGAAIRSGLQSVPYVGPALGLGANVAGAAARGALQGGAANVLTGSADAPDIATAFRQGAVPGAVLGGALGGLAGSAANAVANAGGTPADTNAARLIGVAADQGIPIMRQQVADSPFLARLGNVVKALPFSDLPAAYNQQRQALTGAILREMGDTSGATSFSGDVMARNADRIGNAIESNAAKMNVPVLNNPDTMQAIQQIAGDAADTMRTVAPDSLPAARNLINRVITTAQDNNGNISGSDLQNMVRNNGLLDKVMNGNDPYVADVARQLKGTLLDAATSSDADAAAAWQQARYQWKVMKTMESPVAKSLDGTISPATLQQAIINGFGTTAVARNQAGLMGDLAKIGQLVKPLGTSGTQEHSIGWGLLTGLAGGATALPFAGPAPLLGALGTAGASALGGKIAGAYLRTNMANRLAQQATPGLGFNPLISALVPSLNRPVQQNALAAP